MIRLRDLGPELPFPAPAELTPLSPIWRTCYSCGGPIEPKLRARRRDVQSDNRSRCGRCRFTVRTGLMADRLAMLYLQQYRGQRNRRWIGEATCLAGVLAAYCALDDTLEHAESLGPTYRGIVAEFRRRLRGCGVEDAARAVLQADRNEWQRLGAVLPEADASKRGLIHLAERIQAERRAEAADEPDSEDEDAQPWFRGHSVPVRESRRIARDAHLLRIGD